MLSLQRIAVQVTRSTAHTGQKLSWRKLEACGQNIIVRSQADSDRKFNEEELPLSHGSKTYRSFHKILVHWDKDLSGAGFSDWTEKLLQGGFKAASVEIWVIIISVTWIDMGHHSAGADFPVAAVLWILKCHHCPSWQVTQVTQVTQELRKKTLSSSCVLKGRLAARFLGVNPTIPPKSS